jgi:hypothetical protein
MSSDAITEIAGLEPTFSAREAALILGRSYSWLDQRVRNGEFTLPDGSVVQPLRTAGGYRFFTIEMLKELATCCYRRHWYSFGELKSVFRELVIAAYGDTGDYEIPG